MTLTSVLGQRCNCASTVIPVGATAVWADGRMHRADVCFDTDDLDSFATAQPPSSLEERVALIREATA